MPRRYAVHICSFAGPTVVRGKWRFEFSPQFGPMVLNKDDSPKAQQPSERSPFWPVFEQWMKEGGYSVEATDA